MAKEPNLSPSKRNKPSNSNAKVPVTKGRTDKPPNATKPPPPPPKKK